MSEKVFVVIGILAVHIAIIATWAGIVGLVVWAFGWEWTALQVVAVAVFISANWSVYRQIAEANK